MQDKSITTLGRRPIGRPRGPRMANLSTYTTWTQMNHRCRATTPDHAHYRANGITVCERWTNFENFLADMGQRPTTAHTIDRIDNNGNYEPGNCRWATKTEQNINRSTTVMLTYQGETLCVQHWANRLGINHVTIFARLHKGRSVDEALSTSRLKFTRKRK